MNVAVTALMGLTLSFGSLSHGHRFSFAGEYVEGCSCMGTCPCELTGVAMGCQGVGAFHALRATYGGMEIGEFRAAYAVEPGKWVTLYVDAPNDKFEAAASLMKAALSAFGPMESVKKAKIKLSGHGGMYRATVDDGAIMSLTTEPVLGGDSKTPLVYRNIHDAIHPVIMQGKTVACSYSDGDHKFTLKGSNAYFNGSIKSKGTL